MTTIYIDIGVLSKPNGSKCRVSSQEEIDYGSQSTLSLYSDWAKAIRKETSRQLNEEITTKRNKSMRIQELESATNKIIRSDALRSIAGGPERWEPRHIVCSTDLDSLVEMMRQKAGSLDDVPTSSDLAYRMRLEDKADE